MWLVHTLLALSWACLRRILSTVRGSPSTEVDLPLSIKVFNIPSLWCLFSGLAERVVVAVLAEFGVVDGLVKVGVVVSVGEVFGVVDGLFAVFLVCFVGELALVWDIEGCFAKGGVFERIGWSFLGNGGEVWCLYP